MVSPVLVTEVAVGEPRVTPTPAVGLPGAVDPVARRTITSARSPSAGFDHDNPNEVVARHTGDGSGWKSSLWMILFAMLQVGPLYGAFPVAGLMWRKGTSPRNIFIYLGAFSTLKLPMIGFEVGFLGLKFTLLRAALAVPVFLVMAIVMDKAFGKTFVVNDMAASRPRDSAPATHRPPNPTAG